MDGWKPGDGEGVSGKARERKRLSRKAAMKLWWTYDPDEGQAEVMILAGPSTATSNGRHNVPEILNKRFSVVHQYYGRMRLETMHA